MLRYALFPLLLLGACKRDAPKSNNPAADAASPHARPKGSAGASKGTAASAADFVPAERCKSCHEDAWSAWSDSHHDLAMQTVTASTVLGDFNDRKVQVDGVTTRFFRRGDAYFVNTVGSDGKPADFPVRYVFGVDPLQQVLLDTGRGRLQAFTIAWDVKAKKWFDLYPDEVLAPRSPFHWSGIYQNWNTMCADCHSTALRKGYDPDAQRYNTTFEDLDVGCQACHGPGAAHAEKPSVKMKSVTGAKQIDRCAPCHARRSRATDEPLGAHAFIDQYRPTTLREGVYFVDGQIQEEVYVYGSFTQTKMYMAGVVCSDCHEPHSLKLRAEGNALCTQCHGMAPPKGRFATLERKKYDDPTHHRHKPNTPGAACVSCHMPETTYMVVDPRRDHSFRVPRPDLAKQFGVPNACAQCHDKAPKTWFDKDLPPHFAATFDAARKGRLEALGPLLELAKDETRGPAVRATALELLSGYGPHGQAAKIRLLNASDPWVRLAAISGLDALPQGDRLVHLSPRLRDEHRLVRLEAARALAGLDVAGRDRALLDSLLEELRATERAESDLPSGNLNLAVIAEATGKPAEAERYYRRALEIDPEFLPAVFNLGNLLSQKRPDAAAQLFRGALEKLPDNGELHYSLGLLLAQQENLAGAAASLGDAAKHMPDRPRVRYNYGLALQRLGHRDRAEVELLAAFERQSNNPDFANALTIFYAQGEEWAKAVTYARRTVELAPNAPGPRQMLERLEQRVRGR